MTTLGTFHMRQRLLDLDAGYLCFVTGFVLWLVCRILLTTTVADTAVGSAVGTLVKVGALLCLCSEVFARRFTRGSLVLLLSFALCALNVHRVGGLDPLYLLCVAYTSRHYPLKSILAPVLIVTIATCLAVATLALLQVIPDVTSVTGSRERYSLGFNWVTFPSHYYLEIVIVFAVLRRGRLTRRQLVLLLVLDFVLFEITDSRNSFVLTAVFLVVIYVLQRRGALATGYAMPPWLNRLLTYSFLLGLGISVLIYVLPSPSSGLGVQLNALLSKRVVYTQAAIATYGISPLGTQVTWVTQSLIRAGQYSASQYLYVDCSYLNIAINYGWVFLAFLLSLLTVATRRSLQTACLTLGIGLAFFAIHGIVDPQLLDLHYCIPLVLVGNALDPLDVWTDKMRGLSSVGLDNPS